MAGIFSSLFKHRKPKQFAFKPVYYDQTKEARQQRDSLIKKEIEDEAINGQFRKLLREKWRKNYTSYANKKSNLRIILIATLLALICYLILK